MSLLSSYLPRGMLPIGMHTISTTRTYTFSQDTFALVCLIGGGGGGCSVGHGGGTSTLKLQSQGGNAGGVVYQLIRFLSGQTYTVTIGAGGAGGVYDGVTRVNTGSTGADTTLTSTALATDIVAKGGLAGAGRTVAYATADGTNLELQGQTFGTGADLIFGGGYGGKCSITGGDQIANSGRSLVSGGGAANILGLRAHDCAGGEANIGSSGLSNTSAQVATGGGGIGGKAGYGVMNKSGTSNVVITGAGAAGSAGGNAVMTSGSVLTSLGGDLPLFSSFATLFSLDPSDDATVGNSIDGVHFLTSDTGTPPPGAGSGARSSSNVAKTTPAAGFFGGGGAMVNINSATTTQIITGGAGGLGGGGGGAGCAHPVANHDEVIGGAGGDGLAFLWVLTDFGKVAA